MSQHLIKIFKNNLKYAVIAQGVSFLLSFFMSILAPKIMSVEQFSYWQLFIFYGNYVGLCHMGLSDGVYLRYGGKKLNNSDKRNIVVNFNVMFFWLVSISIVSIPLIFAFVKDENRIIVCGFLLFYLIIGNIIWYWGYVFQAINETSVYSKAIIISKLLFLFFLAVLLVAKKEEYVVYIMFFLISQVVACCYLMIKKRKDFDGYDSTEGYSFTELFENIKVGISLTLSNIVSSFIIGIGRAVIDSRFGISNFGVVSLALSIANFFIQAINAVSMVMFPALRSIEKDRQTDIFVVGRNTVDLVLFAVFLVFIPIKVVLTCWLPAYERSFFYLGLVLPICLFDGKMQLLLTTYMKVCRKERQLLFINVIALLFSGTLSFASAYLFNSITGVTVAIVISVFIRYLISNIVVSNYLKCGFDFNIIYELIFVSTFVFFNAFATNLLVCVVMVTCYMGYVIIQRKNISNIYNGFTNIT